MKRILLAIFTLGIIQSTFAQFSTSGNITSTTNNVGIGTTNPTNTLSVNGSFDVSNAGNHFSYNGAADINFRFAGRGAGGRALVHADGNTLVLNYGGDFTGGTMIGTNAYFTQSTSGSSFIQFGNVGIGTNQPNSKLDIQGGNLSVYNTGAGSFVNIGSSATGKSLLQLGTSTDAGGYSAIQAVESSGSKWGNLNLNPSGGNVGIGTTSPQATLSVKGNTLPTNQWSGYSASLQVGELMIQDYGIVPQVGIGQNTYYDGVATKYILNGYASGMYMGANGNITFSVYNSGTSGNAVSGTGLAMIIANSGNVGIGTTDPGNYKLAVKGSMHTQSVQVDMTGWSDYVFNSSYSLASLAAVNSFIEQNHHLPEMPSAEQVVKDGINLGEMNAKLLMKIEELTLYMIEENKSNQQLKSTVASLQSEVALLKQKAINTSNK